MQKPSVAGQFQTAYDVSDFEIVRNADGAWLVVVPDLPDAIIDNPMGSLRAFLDDAGLVIENSFVTLTFRSLITNPYRKAMEADRPNEVLLCVVDNDGIRTYSRTVPFDI